MTTSAWDSDHPDIELLTTAVQIGVKPSDIAEAVGARALSSGRPFGTSDTKRVQNLIDARRDRVELLNEIARIAEIRGYADAAARASRADERMTDTQLRRMVKDLHDHARRHGIDLRTEDEKHPERRPATDAQIAYILDLLAHRRRSGETDAGFFRSGTTREELAALTTTEASAYIDSLKENY